MEEFNDEVLWEQAVAGRSASFGALFDRHSKTLYNYCFRRTGDWALAEDLMAASFLEAWRKRDHIVLSRGSLLPWLLGVANNLLRNQRRSQRRKDRALERMRVHLEVEPDHGAAVDQRLDDERRMREVLDRLRALSDPDREVIALCVWTGLSYEDAAIAMGVPVGTVRSRLSRARTRLREPAASPGHVLEEGIALARASDADLRRAET